MDAASSGQTGPDPLFARIGEMLRAHALEPTPNHYRVCHRYLSDAESVYALAVDRLIARSGVLTPQLLHELDDPGAPISAETLNGLADDASACLDRVTGLVDDGGRAAQDYGAALAGKAATLVDPDHAAAAIDGLVAVTRRMIDRSRDVSDHLRRTGVELDSLRTKLVEARHHAESDALTGLANRRALDARMTDACNAARRTGNPLAVAICDIDHFKRVNDAHGHLVGDEVIKLVATAIAAAGDAFVSRYGGEEFVVLFDNATPEHAAAQVDAIRRAVAEREVKVAATGSRLGRITFSAGVASLRPRGTASAMLKRADMALYRAKSQGRDRVLVEGRED